MALADIDGDDDLDLFVGGRFGPGRYPEPVSSGLWLNDRGELKFSLQPGQPFESVGGQRRHFRRPGWGRLAGPRAGARMGAGARFSK